MRKPAVTHTHLVFVFLTVLWCCILVCGCGGENHNSGTVENTEIEKEETTPEPSDTPKPAAEPETEEAVIQEDVSQQAEEEVLPVLVPQEPELPGTGKKIAIDPGHQARGNSEQEPIGPGASRTKAKVASGTSGRTTGVAEYELNLTVALKLKEELVQRGYEVYMIRESHDVDISNAERAQMAAESGSDILLRIHANGSENSSVSGALTMAPSQANPYMEGSLVEQCQKLSKEIIEAFCESTGARNQGVYQTDEMSGLNWCTIPATIVEMGYMTNPEEDTRMQTEEYQELMVQGMANGIERYFASE